MKLSAGQPIGGVGQITSIYNNTTPVTTVQPVNMSGVQYRTDILSPMGISINSNFVNPGITSTKAESLFNEILNLLPDATSTDAAINNLKSLVQNRKLSVDRDMSPVSKVFSEKVSLGLKDLLEKDYQAFDRVIDSIIAKDIPQTAQIATTQKSKYSGHKEVGLYEFLKAVVAYMGKQGILNVSNMGKFNKIVQDMVSDTKSKKFSDILSKNNISELYSEFKKYLGGR